MTHITEISSCNISVVMQGAIFDVKENQISTLFIDSLDKALLIFKNSEIIVSSWKMSAEFESWLKIKYPSVYFIFNDDVGAISKEIEGVTVVTNINRMIVSTAAGLKKASRDYAIKLRTDSYIYNEAIVSRLNDVFVHKSVYGFDVSKRNHDYKVFDSHLVNCNLFARNPHSHLPFLYHPGDILLAGLRKDLLCLFDVPLATEEIIKKCSSLRNTCFMSLVPEQYIWVECIKKALPLHDFDFSNFGNTRDEIINSECFYFNNFIPFTANDLGFCWPKHRQVYFNKGSSSIYDAEDWCNLYRKYINNAAVSNSLQHKKRNFIIFFMKLYFFVRSSLLKISFVRKLAYKIFVKRG